MKRYTFLDMQQSTIDALNQLEPFEFMKVLESTLEGVENDLKPHELTCLNVGVGVKSEFQRIMAEVIMSCSDGAKIDQNKVFSTKLFSKHISPLTRFKKLKEALQEEPLTNLSSENLDMTYKLLKKLNSDEIAQIHESNSLFGGSTLKGFNWNLNVLFHPI